MPRTSSNWTIDGMHPAEYAQQWGCGTRDGMRFYNCAAQCPRTGGVMSNPDWDSDDWRKLEEVARAQARAVSRAVRSGAERKRTGWTRKDADNLARLADWAVYMAHRAASTSPWVAPTV